MDPDTLNNLQQLMDLYSLNPYALPWQVTNQTNCW